MAVVVGGERVAVVAILGCVAEGGGKEGGLFANAIRESRRFRELAFLQAVSGWR